MKIITVDEQIISNGKIRLMKRVGQYSGLSRKYSVGFFPADGEMPELSIDLSKNDALQAFADAIKNDMFDK